MTNLEHISDTLSSLQKKSVFKIAIELVKADNQIHRNEVALLDKLQLTFHLSQDELDSTHYLSLQEAVACLHGLDDNTISFILRTFEDVVHIDNDVAFGETIMLSSLKLVLRKESSSWSSIISVPGVEAEVSHNQIVYLEEEYSQSVHAVFDDENDFLLISKALGDIGFQLFYLSNVKEELEQRWGANEPVDSKYDLLQRSVGYLVPSGDKEKIKNLRSILHRLDAKTFCTIVLSRYNITPDQIASKSFLLLKVRDSYVLDDDDILRKTVDFVFMDISRDVKRRILSFVSVFDVKAYHLPYEGYYKLLFDFLSSESKIMSHIELDARFNFFLSDIDHTQIRFESSPQARSFYLLLLKYGQGGIEQESFEKAVEFIKNLNENRYIIGQDLDILSLKSDLLRINTKWALLIYNAIIIYSAVSTKNVEDKSFLKYILNIFQHRSSLKNYINNGFQAISQLANKDQYCVNYNSEIKSYFVSMNPSMFGFLDTNSQASLKLTDSSFWGQLL